MDDPTFERIVVHRCAEFTCRMEKYLGKEEYNVRFAKR